MVRYYLGTFFKGIINKFDIDRLNKVKIDKSLQEIDNFTMNFSTEQELLKYLKDNNIYNFDKDRKIQIVYTYNKKNKKLPVLYSNSKKYMKTEYLRYILKSLSNDIIFLEKLANHFDMGKSSFNLQLSNVHLLRNYINEVRFSNNNEAFFSKQVYDAMEDIFIRAIIKKINNKTGEVEINYRGLRDLAIFVKNYIESVNTKDKEENEFVIRRYVFKVFGIFT